MAYRISSRRHRGRLIIFRITVIALVLGIILVAVDSRLRPVITKIAGSQSQIIAVQAINTAVTEGLSDNEIKYENLVKIDKDADNRVTALSTDIIAFNKLKSKLALAIQSKLDEIDEKTVTMPLGTLLGTDFLVGRGPKFNFKLQTIGNAILDIENSFDYSGINQTRHQILLNVTVYVRMITAGYNVYEKVSTHYIIAETIIVGLVPDSFTNVDDGRLGSGIIQDYSSAKNK